MKVGLSEGIANFASRMMHKAGGVLTKNPYTDILSSKYNKKVGGYLFDKGVGMMNIGDAIRSNKAINLSGLAASSIGGGLAGGTYGAFSGDTSILGGAIKGAALGAAGYGGVQAGIAGYQRYSAGMALGLGAGKSLSAAAQLASRDSMKFIGNTKTKAINGFNALKSMF